jgi:hypothetical protein
MIENSTKKFVALQKFVITKNMIDLQSGILVNFTV